MRAGVLWFLRVLFKALALAPGMAHLLELPNKIHLPREEYAVVQQIYRGWSWLGIVVLAALATNAALTLVLARRRRPFGLPLLATLAVAATQVVFWVFTFPANRATDSWRVQPEHWAQLRMQGEYSHAASAVLDLIALIALLALVAGVVWRADGSAPHH